MKSNYKMIFFISFFLLILSVGTSISYYMFSVNSMEKQLKTQSLPLSVDNIYTSIQKHIIEPYLVSSMMASDTFLKDWLINREKETAKIEKYLSSINKKYDTLIAFLVSQKSKNYYTQDGFIEKISRNDLRNSWYFKFKKLSENHEINIDSNGKIANSIIMFINFKIFDNKHNLLGVTGVGIKISYINKMLEMFKKRYKLSVMFIDKKGNIILVQNNKYTISKNIKDIKKYKNIKNTILSNNTNQLEFKNKHLKYLLNIKYIKELNLYLLVEAKLSDFTKDTKQIFYINLTISLISTLIIAMIIIKIVRNYNKKLELLSEIDPLTDISNRRNFTKTIDRYISLCQRERKPLSILFIDIDNFKNINDTFGHETGDKVLVEFAKILKNNTRDSDICARWGGEEFILAFLNVDKNSVKVIANKIRNIVANNTFIKNLIDKNITISAGISQYKNSDTIDTLISRADNAMYEAKNSGKNQVKIS